MGYRSDILLAIVFKTKEHRDEVWAIYCMDPLVQKHDVASQWAPHDGDRFSLWFEGNHLKWYESYEDVQAFEHLQTVAAQFAEHRDFPYAYIKLRIGENTDDIEEVVLDDDKDGELRDYLFDMTGVSRSINNGFA
jgi:hypothetical protein